jgi:hypothetical protein
MIIAEAYIIYVFLYQLLIRNKLLKSMNFGRRFVVSGCSLALLGVMRPAHSSKAEDKHNQCFIWGNGYY